MLRNCENALIMGTTSGDIRFPTPGIGAHWQ